MGQIFEGYYVTPCGKVYSYNQKGFLKGVDLHGYRQVHIISEGKPKKYLVHRMVAMCWLPNPLNLPIINHKDENKQNNIVSNLEWCTYGYNLTYNNLKVRNAQKTGKKVVRVEDGEVYYSIREAARRNGVSKNAISVALNNEKRTAKGYHWQMV